MIDMLHKMLSNDRLVAFHYKSYGTFLILKKPYNSRAVLPTIKIIEPVSCSCIYFFIVASLSPTVLT